MPQRVCLEPAPEVPVLGARDVVVCGGGPAGRAAAIAAARPGARTLLVEKENYPGGCLVAKGVDGLLMAGRCLSAGHHAEASLRILQTCMATGQAAQKNQLCIATVYFEQESDRDWAIETWRSIRHRPIDGP